MLTCVDYVDTQESVCVRKLLRAAPHGNHHKVDDGRYTKKALRKRVSVLLLTIQ